MRYLLLLLLLPLCASSQALQGIVGDTYHSSGSTTPAFVSASSGDSGGSSTGTAQTGATNLASGNLLVVGCVSLNQTCGAAGTATVTDTASNTFTAVGNITDGASALCLEVFYAKNTASNASNQVTCTFASQQAAVSAMQISGASTTAPYVTSSLSTGATNGSFGTSATVSAAMNPASGTMIVCPVGLYAQNRTASTSTSGFTIPAASISSGTKQSAAMYNTYPSGGSSISPSVSISGAASLIDIGCIVVTP